MLDSFFKKDVTVYPSGVQASQEQDSKYKKAFKSLGFAFTCVAMAASLSGCSVGSDQAKEEMKSLTESEKVEMMGLFNRTVLHKIDSLETAGLKTPYSKALSITWDEARKSMPEKTDDWSGKDLFIHNHADSLRYATTVTRQMGKFVEFVTNKNFKKDLAASVKAFNEDRATVDSLALVKIDSLTNKGVPLVDAVKQGKEEAYQYVKTHKPSKEETAAQAAYKALRDRVTNNH